MKQEKEIETVSLMIGLYCQKKHGTKKGELCPECRQLLEYVKFRRMKCPWGDKKPFCANCSIHCYKPDMREKIARVMRFSGPEDGFLPSGDRIQSSRGDEAAEEKTEKSRGKKGVRICWTKNYSN